MNPASPSIQHHLALPQDAILAFCRRWKITALSLFGSVLRDDFRPDSDVDVLVSFDPESRWSLLDLARIQRELETILGRNVDLVTRSSVENSHNWIRREAILSTAQPIYTA